MIAKYEFKELQIEKARELSNSLGFVNAIEENMTLADIYNQADKDFSKSKREDIGFKLNGEEKQVAFSTSLI